MTNDSENVEAEMPLTYQQISNDPSVAASRVSDVATKAAMVDLTIGDLDKGSECMPADGAHRRFREDSLETCNINFPAVRLAPVTAAELVDLRTKGGNSETENGNSKTKGGRLKIKGGDPKTLPDSVIHLSAFYIERSDTPVIYTRYWTSLTRAHIDRTCARMWRPAKRERQEIRNNNITTSQGLTELYIRCFPDQTLTKGNNNPADPGSETRADLGSEKMPRKWEVLLPHLVTFVLRDVKPEDDATSSPPRADRPAELSSTATPASPSAAAGLSSAGPSSSSAPPAPAPASNPNPKSGSGGNSKPSKSKSKKSKAGKPKAGRHQHTLRARPRTPSPPPTPPPPPSTPPRPQRPQKPVIRYLPAGARDKQPRAEFIAALTAAFACERVRAPDLRFRWVMGESRMRRRFMGGFIEGEVEEGDGGQESGNGRGNGKGDGKQGNGAGNGNGKGVDGEDGTGKGKEVDRGEGKGMEIKNENGDGEKGEEVEAKDRNKIEESKRWEELCCEMVMAEATTVVMRDLYGDGEKEERDFTRKGAGVDDNKQGEQETDGVKGAEVKNGQGSAQNSEHDGDEKNGNGKELDKEEYGKRREMRFSPKRWLGNTLPPDPPIEQRTMLVFAAGTCLGPRGGIGVVTKETVHFHEKPVWTRIAKAEQWLSDPSRKSAFESEYLRKMKLCIAALEKPGRGFRPDLHGAMPPKQVECALLGGTHKLAMERWLLDVDPARFGYVECRYRPAWWTRKDVKSDEQFYYVWGLANRRLEEGGRQYRIDSGAVGGGAVDGGEGAEDNGAGPDEQRVDGEADGDETGDEEEEAKMDGFINDDESDDDEEGGAPLYGDMDGGAEDGEEGNDDVEDEDYANQFPDPVEQETEERDAESGNGNKKPSEPKPKKKIITATPNRVAARALLAAVQIVPFDFGHCTRLIIATNSEHAIEMATNRLQNMLERGLPFQTARGQDVEDQDIWWEFAGTVKDLAYRGVEVAIMRCREGEGIRLPVGDDGYVFGMDQAIKAANDAARELWRRDKEARVHHKDKGDREFVRLVSLYA